MDGMYSNGNFLTKCHNVKPVPYQAEVYPYDSGWACPKCWREWSELEIARGRHLKDYKITEPTTDFSAFRKSIKKKTSIDE